MGRKTLLGLWLACWLALGGWAAATGGQAPPAADQKPASGDAATTGGAGQAPADGQPGPVALANLDLAGEPGLAADASKAAPVQPATAAGPGAPFDPEAATAAYLATVPADKRARSDAYFEGGYWLQLWNFLLAAGIALLLLAGRWSARMRDLAERITRRKPLQTLLYFAQYVLVTTLLTFPLTVYAEFFREHAYGLATQGFGAWLGDQAKGLAVAMILGGLLMALLYGIFRKLPKTWWIWGTVATVGFLMVSLAIGPLFIEPLFNTYTKLDDPAVREPILRLARANGVAAHDVWVVDASRQTTRVSANVAGFMGTQRIALNDNLLKRCSLPEIETVMAHEIGHYVLNHVPKMLLFFGVFIAGGFAFVRWAFEACTRRWGNRWGVRGIGDVAGLPLLLLLLSVYFFVLTPVTNTYSRMQEEEADLFALNAARQPDGEAEVDLKLGEYRKLAPGPVEEFLFFDHPSGRTRILMAMRWKAEHLDELPGR
jgi:STE24 endopeptidase